MKIPVMIEPAYRDSFWCEQTVLGIQQEAERKKYELVFIDGLNSKALDDPELFGGGRRLLMLLGTSVSWIPDAITQLQSRGIGAVLVSYQPPEHQYLQGIVRMDYASAMDQLLNYFDACGHSRVALYGMNPNSSADRIKQQFFAATRHTQGDVFFNEGSLEACFHSFLPHVHDYDALLCANDIVAVSAMRRLRAEGIRVPEDLYVAGFGDSMLSIMCQPTLTTASLDHMENGREATLLFAQLCRLPEGISISVRVKSRLTIRESTALKPVPETMQQTPMSDAVLPVDFYADKEAQDILRIADLIAHCDALDLSLLEGLREGKTYEYIAEASSTTESTLRYRLKRMLQATGAGSREELLDMLSAAGLGRLNVDILQADRMMGLRKGMRGGEFDR